MSHSNLSSEWHDLWQCPLCWFQSTSKLLQLVLDMCGFILAKLTEKKHLILFIGWFTSKSTTFQYFSHICDGTKCCWNLNHMKALICGQPRLGYRFTIQFLCCLRSIAAHRVHFVRRLSVRPSVWFLNIVAAFWGMHVSPSEECMCCLRNIAMRDYKKVWLPDRQTETDAGQSEPYVPLCIAGDTQSEPYVPLCFACDTKMLVI